MGKNGFELLCKNEIKMIKGERIFNNEDKVSYNFINKKILRSFFIIFHLILFPMVFEFGNLSRVEAECPIPAFGLVPQESRRNNKNIDYSLIEFVGSPDNLEEITFNSEIMVKLQISVRKFVSTTIIADLVPDIRENNGKMKPLPRQFKSKSIQGTFR